MDCQHVQQMLAFVERKCDAVESVDRDAVQQHLAKCPACAAFAKAERRLDEALGPVLRDVPVPADLQQKVMKRLAAERASAPWTARVPWKPGIAAAAILLALASGLVWYFDSAPELKRSDVEPIFAINGAGNWDEDAARKYLQENGFSQPLPGRFDYQFLQNVELIDLKGRAVAKLTFFRPGEFAEAVVLIFPSKQFRTNGDLKNDETFIQFRHDDEGNVTYLILFRGSLELLQRPQQMT